MHTHGFPIGVEECVIKALKSIVIKLYPESIGGTPLESKFDIAKVLFLCIKGSKELQICFIIPSTILSLLLKHNAGKASYMFRFLTWEVLKCQIPFKSFLGPMISICIILDELRLKCTKSRVDHRFSSVDGF